MTELKPDTLTQTVDPRTASAAASVSAMSRASRFSTKIHLDFQGYWRLSQIDAVPNQPGVFCVYRGEYRDGARSTVMPRQLLYVGEAIAVRARIRELAENAAERTQWERHLRPREELLVTFAPIIIGRTRARAALVFNHRPPENVEFKFRFPYESTTLLLSGKIASLQVSFTAPDPAAESAHEELAPRTHRGTDGERRRPDGDERRLSDEDEPTLWELRDSA